MGIIKGLAKQDELEAELARRRQAREDAANAPRANWFKLDDGKSVKVRFLQELDMDSPNYSAKNDIGFIAIEHSAPSDFRRKALCTRDDGADCWACEQHETDYKAGWKPGSRLYINAVLNPETDNEEVVVISQGTSGKAITPTLREYAGETGSITDREWKITRNGKGTETSWTIIAFDKKEFTKNVEDYEIFDLEKVAVRNVPYEEQETFYGGNTTAKSEESKPRETAGAGDFNSW